MVDASLIGIQRTLTNDIGKEIILTLQRKQTKPEKIILYGWSLKTWTRLSWATGTFNYEVLNHNTTRLIRNDTVC